MKKPRPKNLNLTTMRLTIPALVSILHRISGVGLFLAIPLLLLALEVSLRSERHFDLVARLLAHPLSKLLLIVVLCGALHHILAGLRHFAFDLGYGSRLKPARISGWLVLLGSLALTAAVGVMGW